MGGNNEPVGIRLLEMPMVDAVVKNEGIREQQAASMIGPGLRDGS